MKTIRDNIVGLLKFFWLLPLMLIPVRKSNNKVIPYPRGKEPLAPIETKFCPRCHVAVAQIRRTKEGTQLLKKGKVLITIGSNVVNKDVKKIKGIPVLCPNGHIVRVGLSNGLR